MAYGREKELEGCWPLLFSVRLDYNTCTTLSIFLINLFLKLELKG
jgi:hypothetical protein